MRNSVWWSVILVAALGCSQESSGEDVGVDAAVDAGVRALCPEVTAACQKAGDCGGGGSAPSNCGTFCPDYNENLCVFGTCESPAADAVVNLQFEIEQFIVDRAQIYVGVAISAEAAGGVDRTCADGRLESFSPCLNVVDVRHTGKPPVGANGTQIPLRVPVGRPLLLQVYGFPEAPANGEPIGFSCTEFTANEPNPVDPDIPGDRMKQIQ
ncbi:MAG: hypothetical protein HY791_30780 [Deltaproteobacteria bacterium]|nr:hypothetical protein [Deltaproteobacteria bacterium]